MSARRLIPFVLCLVVVVIAILISLNNRKGTLATPITPLEGNTQAIPNEIPSLEADIRPDSPIPEQEPTIVPKPDFYPENGLVLFWRFDGDTSEYTGKTHEVVAQSLTYGAGIAENGVDQALTFNGTDSMCGLANIPDMRMDGAVTVSCWVNMREQKSQDIVRIGAGLRELTSPYGLSFSATGDCIFTVNVGGNVLQVRKKGYDLHQWINIVGVFDGTTAKLYYNGELVGQKPCAGTLWHVDNAPMILGTRLALPADTLHGSIDNLRIYNISLTAADIEQAYRAQAARIASPGS